jgi:hypothetical protein
MPRVRFIHPMYSFGADYTHIAVPRGEAPLAALRNMQQELEGTEDLIAIYIPESTLEHYDSSDREHGRIVALVRLAPMPQGRSEEDYGYPDWDSTDRWPHGWPCTVVRMLQPAEQPTLRGLVEIYHPSVAYVNYVARLQIMPIRLDGDPIGDELTRRFCPAQRLTP